MPIEPSSSWLDKIIRSMYPDEPLPRVEPPPVWRRPEIPVVGDKELGREVYQFAKKFPSISDSVKSVSLGPTTGSMNKMFDSGLPMGAFENTNLLGVYGIRDQTIGLNPGLTPSPERSRILGHEMGHASGLMSERLADVSGIGWQDYYSKNPYRGR